MNIHVLSPQNPSDCFVSDSFGTRLDFSHLKRTEGNNHRARGGGDHWYELNVCAPLVETGSHLQQGCNDADVAVCQSNNDNTTFISAGALSIGSSREVFPVFARLCLIVELQAGAAPNLPSSTAMLS